MSVGVLVRRQGRYKPARRTAKGELCAIDPIERIRVCDGSRMIYMPAREFERAVHVTDSWECGVGAMMGEEGNIVDADPK